VFEIAAVGVAGEAEAGSAVRGKRDMSCFITEDFGHSLIETVHSPHLSEAHYKTL